MKRAIKRPELLAPGGTLEKLKKAIDYGADAVYIGGTNYGLRSRAGNFTYEEMAEAVAYANAHNARVHVAANIVAHEGDTIGVGEFFKKLRDIGITAVIVSDPSMIEICLEEAPGLEVHLSTQASTTNVETFKFWQEEGLSRVVLAREMSIDEINYIRDNTDIEIESFIHGAMCISYSGRCTLSNHMSMRDANRGGCSQSCRWKYELFDMPFAGEHRSLTEEAEIKDEPFSMSAVDLAMIEHIPDLIEAGVDSFKIEGRMKTIHYVSTVVNVYRKAIDSYLADPDNYELKQEWIDELWKVAQRELSTGFYYGIPDENAQLFGERRKIPVFKFIGEVLAYDEETKMATIRQRNRFKVGEQIEFYGPGFTHHEQTVEQMWNEDGEEITVAPNPMMILTMPVKHPVKPGDMLRKAVGRKKKESNSK